MLDQTCGERFSDALHEHTDMSPEQVLLFAKGFLTGQAEKATLGACAAVMIRPSVTYWDAMRPVVEATATRYGLRWLMTDGEFWLYRWEAHGLMTLMMRDLPRNSQAWHTVRGMLCGVPISEIDPSFHLRKGYGEMCDLPREASCHA